MAVPTEDRAVVDAAGPYPLELELRALRGLFAPFDADVRRVLHYPQATPPPRKTRHTMPRDSPYSDWRVIFLKYAVVLGRHVLPKWLRLGFAQLFLSISPSIPVDLPKALGKTPLKRLFWVAFTLAVFFCFVVTLLLCLIEGTLYGSDVTRRYFVQDGWNIFFYILVCPAYVAFSCSLVALTINEWATLADYADQKADSDPRPRSAHRLYLVFFFALLLCTLFITNYIYDILHLAEANAARARVYWFMQALSDGTRTLNRVGYYYVTLNFALLFITLLGVASFFSLAAEVIRAGSASTADRIDSFEILHVKLASFTTGYLLMKALTATYAINYFVWAVSPLGKTDNLLAAQIALTVVGVFFVAMPRHYIELKWYELWQSSGRSFEFADTRPPYVKASASFLDAFFIAAIMSSWGIEALIAKWIS